MKEYYMSQQKTFIASLLFFIYVHLAVESIELTFLYF